VKPRPLCAPEAPRTLASAEIRLRLEQKIQGTLAGFLNSADQYASRPALYVEGQEFTYSELREKAMSISAAIARNEQGRQPLAALLACRSVTAYAGILGILGSGRGYVPLNPKFPLERTRTMLHLSGCETLIVGREAVSQLPGLLGDQNRPLRVILPDTTRDGRLASELPQHRVVFANDVPKAVEFPPSAKIDPHAIAYLLFTSGSTGIPKGVPIHHTNVRSYVEYICDRYQVTHEDRFSQEFDLTFDLSVHDMFVCWERGACLFVVPERSVMAPAKFIREHRLTMWFSVPSVIGLLSRLKLLSPGAFPSLRYSLFCGEPLSANYAQFWQAAAPRSAIENLYGPTETTIAITHYRWDAERSPSECVNGVVPIGWPFKGQRVCVTDQNHKPVFPGGSGELCLSGSQVTTGYWNNPAKTQEQFIRLPETGESSWYRTGDVARQDEKGCLFYLGRIDHQIKIRGYRVELQEIEAVLRKLCGSDQIVSLPWPVQNGIADGVVAFVAGTTMLDLNRILSATSELLPDYMVPKNIYTLQELPLSPNGKVDRGQLSKFLEGMKP
jgi:amino acid adenylation domain-containing protein